MLTLPAGGVTHYAAPGLTGAMDASHATHSQAFGPVFVWSFAELLPIQSNVSRESTIGTQKLGTG